MIYFPAFINLEGKNVVICGGGKHALEKIQRLLPFRPRITVISPGPSSEILNHPGIDVKIRRFTEEDADCLPAMVIAAEDTEENRRIGALCRSRRILFNAVDQQEDCDFIFSAMIPREPMCIGISSGGASPAAAVEVKKQLEQMLPENLEEILLWLSEVRTLIYSKIHAAEDAKKLLSSIVHETFLTGRPLSQQQIDNMILAHQKSSDI